MMKLRAVAVIDLASGVVRTCTCSGQVEDPDSASDVPPGTRISARIVNTWRGNPFLLSVYGIVDEKPRCSYDCPNVPWPFQSPVTALKVMWYRVSGELRDGSVVATVDVYVDGDPSQATWWSPIEIRIVDHSCRTYVRLPIRGPGYTYRLEIRISPPPPPGTYRIYLECHAKHSFWQFWCCCARTELFIEVPQALPTRLTIEKFCLVTSRIVHVGPIPIPKLVVVDTVKPGMEVAPGFRAVLDRPLPRDGTLNVKLVLNVEELGSWTVLDTCLRWPSGKKVYVPVYDKVKFRVPDLHGEPGRKYRAVAELVLVLEW